MQDLWNRFGRIGFSTPLAPPPSNMDAQQLRQALSAPTPNTRSHAISAVGQSGNPALVGPLVAHLRTEEDQGVRVAVVSALSHLIPKNRMGNLAELMEDRAPAVRCRVLEVLYEHGCESVFPLAVRSISDSDTDVRGLGLKVLGKLGAKNLLHLLRRLLGHDQVHWRIYALSAIGHFKNNHMVPLLVEAMKDPVGQIRMQARASLLNLANLGSYPAKEFLEKLDGAVEPKKKRRVLDLSGEKTVILDSPLEALGPKTDTNATIELKLPLGPTSATALPENTLDPLETREMSTRVMREIVEEGRSAPERDPNVTVVLSTKDLPGANSGPPPGGLNPREKVAVHLREKKKRMSTGVYKALFGESVPRIPRPTIEPEIMGEIGEHDETIQAEEDQPTFELAEAKQKKPWDDNVCRDCWYAKRKRPDMVKMSPMRLWCGVYKKETSMAKTCKRGRWGEG